MTYPSVPLRRIARILNGGTPPSGTADYWNGDVPFVTPPDLNGLDGGLVASTARAITLAGLGYSGLAPAGSVLLSTRAPIGHIGRADHPAAFNQGCRALVPLRRHDDRFLAYALVAAREDMNARGLGTTFVELSGSALAQIEVPLAPLSHQLAIADYLDREMAQIDAFIAKNEELVSLLTERRASTIVESIGSHASIPLKRLVSPTRPLTYGILQCGPPVDDGVPYIGPSDLPGEGKAPNLASLRRTTAAIAAAYTRSRLQGGDIVVSIGPAYGRVGLIPNELTGANLTQDTVRVAIIPGAVDPEYLVWVLSSRIAGDFWNFNIDGATFRRLNLGTLGETPIPHPPVETQRRIVDAVSKSVETIDRAISVTKRSVTLARERRAALISAAVTGKIDVGGTA